jgi:thioredoxin 1
MQRLNSENFEQEMSSVRGPFLIKFFSASCGPCATMNPVVEKFESENPNISVFDVDTSASPELAGHFEVRGVPTMHICENREIIYSFVGVTPLAQLNYVFQNINDPYFRAHGEFKKAESKGPSWFYIIVLLIVVGYLAALFI